MPDTTTPNKHWWWALKDIFISFVTALGLDFVMKEFAKATVKAGARKVGHKITNDKRAELLEEFRLLEKEQVAQGKNIDNLWRRHRESEAQLRENHFVDMLTKLCPAGTAGRRDSLLWLNDMDDAKFNQMLNFLDHDVISQWFGWLWRIASRVGKKALNELKALFQELIAATSIGVRNRNWNTAGLIARIRSLRALLNEGVSDEEDHSLFYELWFLLYDAGSATGKWLRIAIVVIISWPIFLLLCSMYGTDTISWLTCGIFTPETITWLPILTFLPVLLIVVGFFWVPSIVITLIAAAWFNRRSRMALMSLVYFLGYGLILGLYLSAVPLAKDRELVPILLLLSLVLCIFRKKVKIWNFFAPTFVLLTIIFILGGRTEAMAKVTRLKDRVITPSANSTGGPTFTYNPQQRYCDGHKYYDPRYDFHADTNRDEIVIVLQEGCNGPRRIFPDTWAGNFTVQLSQNPGDYVSVSCTEHGTQSRAFPTYGSLNGLFEDCEIPQRREPDGTVIPGGISPDFSPQGRGVLIATRGSTRTLPRPVSLFDQQ